jgi:hypothetical protein
VPQVQRVGDRPQVAQRPQDEQPVGPQSRTGGPGHDDGRGGQGRPQGDVPGEDRRHLQERPAQHQGGQPAPAQRHPGRPRGPQARQQQGQEPAERELPQPGAGVEVGPRLVGPGHQHRVGQREREDRRQRAHQRGPRIAPRAPGRPHRDRDQRGPQQVELPLDRQGPEVLERADVPVPRQVVHRVQGQVPVRVVEQGRDRVPRGVAPPDLGQQEPGRGQGRQDHDGGGRYQARRQPRQERPVADPLAGGGAHEGGGDEEARQHQEDVDTAGDPPQPDVVGGHQEHGHGPQAVDLGPVPAGTGDGARRARRSGADGGEGHGTALAFGWGMHGGKAPLCPPRMTARRPARELCAPVAYRSRTDCAHRFRGGRKGP